MNLSIILPAYNEETIIAQTLDAHLDWKPPDGISLQEIIVVEDGSIDQTSKIVTAYAQAHPVIRLIKHPVNRGKGAALQSGVLSASGNIIAPIHQICTLSLLSRFVLPIPISPWAIATIPVPEC
ncbi:glycosyltransferase [bacterium]|nr:glycosyltransferase [bacterium]